MIIYEVLCLYCHLVLRGNNFVLAHTLTVDVLVGVVFSVSINKTTCKCFVLPINFELFRASNRHCLCST